jgi:hypothetical protein
MKGIITSNTFDDLPTPADTEEYIAWCIAARDQAPDLREYLIHHYYHHGVRRFYIEDDSSNPPLSSFDYPIPREALTFRYHKASPQEFEKNNIALQMRIYDMCRGSYGARHTWMAYFDVDEYLEVKAPETLKGILQEFEANSTIGSVAVNWRVHTSAGLLHRPESVRKSFDVCIDDRPKGFNKRVKSIVRMAYLPSAGGSPHVFHTNSSTIPVGANGDKLTNMDGDHTPISHSRMILHQYVFSIYVPLSPGGVNISVTDKQFETDADFRISYAVKSREEFERKMDMWGNPQHSRKRNLLAARTRTESFWKSLEEDYSHVPCRELTEYRP